jgi:phospho-N-acetylmuramoyl-pentapeptide-transferase
VLYHLFNFLEREYDFVGAGLFKYITFRAGIALLLSLIISMLLGGRFIRWIGKMQIIEKEQRNLGLPDVEQKKKTPTMGGLLIIVAILLPCLLVGDLTNIYIQIMILSTILMGGLGFMDDYLKLTKGKDGLAARYKLAGQISLGLIVGLVMSFHKDVVVRMTPQEANLYHYEIVKQEKIEDPKDNTKKIEMVYVKTTLTNVPFFKGNNFEYRQLLGFLGNNADRFVWLIFIPLVIFIVTAVSNAANLTDGIDGLAATV